MSLTPTWNKTLRRLLAPLDRVTRDWLLISGGHAARMALGLIPSILIARSLGAADFGVYGILTAVSGIASVVTDAGLTATASRQINAIWPGDEAVAQQWGRVFFWSRLLLAFALLSAGFFLAEPLATQWLRLQNGETSFVATLVLRLTLLGVGATTLSGAVTGMLQASRRFKQITQVVLVNAGLTAVLAILLSLVGRLTLVTALVLLGIGTSLVSFVVAWRCLPRPFDLGLPTKAAWQVQGSQLFRFTGWVGLSNILIVLTSQLDVILLNRWGTATGASALGLYFLALNLTTKTNILNHSLYTVLLPTVSSLKNRADYLDYVRLGLKRGLGIALFLLPLLGVAGPFIRFFYGAEFAPAVPLFQWLLLLVIFDVFTLPITWLAFPINKPYLLATADALRLIILLAGAAWLIPLYGPLGMIAAKAGAKLVGFLFILMALRRQQSL